LLVGTSEFVIVITAGAVVGLRVGPREGNTVILDGAIVSGADVLDTLLLGVNEGSIVTGVVGLSELTIVGGACVVDGAVDGCSLAVTTIGATLTGVPLADCLEG
jgi:glutamate synthase domain-containing protein 2